MREYTTLVLLILMSSTLLLAKSSNQPAIAAINHLRPCFATADDAFFARAYQRYTTTGKIETRKMLAILPGLAPHMEAVLAAEGLPQWLLYVTMAESRLRLSVKSQAGAAGLWQIMPATGRSLGLRIDKQVDERLDLIRSTQAAARYLKQLYHQFDDWLLALAAYNCGAGKVRQAQRRAKAYDYAAIRKYLPGQTRRYLPRVFTIAQIATQPEAHGFNTFDTPPLQKVAVYRSSSFQELATCFQVSPKLIATYNPAWQSSQVMCTKQSSTHLWLPEAVAARLHISPAPLSIRPMLALDQPLPSSDWCAYRQIGLVPV